MAQCGNIDLTVYIWRTDEGAFPPLPPIKLATLTFPALRYDPTNGTLSGDVFSGTTLLSRATGTCRSLTKPDGKALTLEFNWGSVDLFVVGFIHSPLTLFKGRYIAFNHVGLLPTEFDKRLTVLVAPGDGETGTTTGQQT
jgi:hypothetical protein